VEKFKHGHGWFNAIVATMALNPCQKNHEIIDLVCKQAAENDKNNIGVPADVVASAFERLPVQLNALHETGAARTSGKGRLVVDLPIGQLAWKSGYNFRNAKPYLHLWLNGVLIYTEN